MHCSISFASGAQLAPVRAHRYACLYSRGYTETELGSPTVVHLVFGRLWWRAVERKQSGNLSAVPTLDVGGVL